VTRFVARSRHLLSLSAALSALAFAACQTDDGDADLKEDARRDPGGKADGTDICADNGWYDDDVCDTFCPLPDPDCGDTGTSCPNDDSCVYADDNVCDDGGAGSSFDVCAAGTDFSDCGFRTGDECEGGGDTCANDDSCTYANDGACDDGGEGSSFDVCTIGTDVSDCGFRSGSDCSGDASECANDDSCTWSSDGFCDDGGEGSSFSLCTLGTDITDCGFRGADVCNG